MSVLIEKVLACCKNILDDIWELSWIEHGRLKRKYVKSKSHPSFQTFSAIKKLKEIPQKDVLNQVLSRSIEERRFFH